MPAGLVIDEHLHILREGRLALRGPAPTGDSVMIALLDRRPARGAIGVPTAAGVELRLELTHAQWARLVGCSRESVTLASMTRGREGSIEVAGRTVTIPWPGGPPAGGGPAATGSARSARGEFGRRTRPRAEALA